MFLKLDVYIHVLSPFCVLTVTEAIHALLELQWQQVMVLGMAPFYEG